MGFHSFGKLIFLLIWTCFLLTESIIPTTIENLYVPRFCHSITADVLFISADKSVATFGEIILGDIVDCTDTGDTVSEQYCVELKGEMARPSGECMHFLPSTKQNIRHLDLKYDGRYWHDSVVYYTILDGFDNSVRKAILTAIWFWSQSSPARFIESATEYNRVEFTPIEDESCVSYVGQIGGTQTVVLHATGSCNVGRITHEIGHAIGFYHEHTRPDRENYIVIQEGNILEGYTSQYDEVTGHLYGEHEYDYGSLMHYPQDGFSDNGEDTIDVIESEFASFIEKYPNELPDGEVGQRFFLSTIDKQMGYTYLDHCENQYSGTGYEWSVGMWGGCEPQCPVSYRQRVVHCRYWGNCVNETLCDPTTRPDSRMSCELGPGATTVTFEGNNSANVSSPMQNVPLYDQFDWYLWEGYTANLIYSGNTIDGENQDGPGTDADGHENGHYLWFTCQDPATSYDEAWYESPIVATTNEDLCTVTFSYFITGKSGKLQVFIVPCSDCSMDEEIWSSASYSGHQANVWNSVSIEVPEYADDDVRLRFVAHCGSSGTPDFGLDNLGFSAECARSEVPDFPTDISISSPYVLDFNCIYIPPEDFSWGAMEIGLLAAACVIFVCLSVGIIECIIRRRKRNKVRNSIKLVSDHESHHSARMHLKKTDIFHIFTASSRGISERFHKKAHAVSASINKLMHSQRHDIIMASHGHENKSHKSVHYQVQEKKGFNKIRTEINRSKTRFHHWSEKSGLLDRLDSFIKIGSCGTVSHGPSWHIDTNRAEMVKDRRSMKHLRATYVEDKIESH